MYIFRLFILCSIFLLMSCGGGGGSSGSGSSGSKTSITVNPNSLEFTVNTNSSSAAKPVSVSFKGDGMLVGYPVGSVDPGWLTVDVSESYSSPVTVNIQVHSYGMPTGTHSTTLRFVTGKEDGSNVVYKDVPVTMIVEEGASISNESLNFSSLESVPAENKSFNITTKSAREWSLSVQYTSTETNWLTLSQSSGNLSANGSTSVTVSTKGIKQGTHTASIILKDKSGSTIDSVNVSYQVNSGVTVGNVSPKTITEKASVADLQWLIPIQSLYDPTKGSTINWTLTSDKDWLKVVSVAGNLGNTQHLQLELELDADKLLMLDNGNQPASVSIKFNDTNITDFSVPVNLALNIDAKLTVTGYLGFTLDNDSTDASLEKTVQIGTNVGTAFSRNMNWRVAVQSDWLKAVNATGNTTSQNSLTLKVEKSYLSTFKGNLDSAFISIIPDNPAFDHYAELVALQIYIPQIDSVTPYVGYTNHSGPLLISGSNFGLKSKWKIDFGGYLVDALVVDNNTLRVDYPPITSPQALKLNIPNALNVNKSTANFLIKDPQTYVTHKIETGKLYERIALDAERDAIILSGSSANQITRYKYENSLWSASFYPMEYSQNAELSADGKEILVAIGTQNSADSLIQLNADDLSFKKNSVISSEPYSEFSIILPLANAKTLLIDKRLWNDALIFPTMNTIRAPQNLSGWISAYMPRNRGRFIIVGDRGAFSFNASGTGYVDCPIIFPSASYPYIMSMSADSSRIVANATVYGADCNLLGSLYPIPNNLRLVAVAPDGKYVYAYHYLDPYYNWNQNTPVIRRYDISTSGGTFLEDVGGFNYVIDPKDYPVDMEVSDDGRALFLLTTNSDSGLSSIYIIPLTN